MELKDLYEKTLTLFSITDSDGLGAALMDCVNAHDEKHMDDFVELIDGDLSKDWLQMIFQYYQADRDEKKQDYTPQSLAMFLSKLIGDSTETIDMCAGSGALTIQRWLDMPDTVFRLYEIDETVIPYLLFNLCIRNISAEVYQGDVLQASVEKQWIVRKGEKYGSVSCIEPTV